VIYVDGCFTFHHVNKSVFLIVPQRPGLYDLSWVATAWFGFVLRASASPAV
jgi:hypothetical protein